LQSIADRSAIRLAAGAGFSAGLLADAGALVLCAMKDRAVFLATQPGNDMIDSASG